MTYEMYQDAKGAQHEDKTTKTLQGINWTMWSMSRALSLTQVVFTGAHGLPTNYLQIRLETFTNSTDQNRNNQNMLNNEDATEISRKVDSRLLTLSFPILLWNLKQRQEIKTGPPPPDFQRCPKHDSVGRLFHTSVVTNCGAAPVTQPSTRCSFSAYIQRSQSTTTTHIHTLHGLERFATTTHTHTQKKVEGQRSALWCHSL